MRAVISDAESKGYSQVWNAGDSVGYCTFPNEVCGMLREIGAVSIAGNYDRKVLSFEKNRSRWAKKKDPRKYASFQWTYDNLSGENREFLESLPGDIWLEVEGVSVLICHGSPANDQEYICGETTDRRLKELAGMARTDVVLSGHSHKVFSRRVENVLFVNPGSVGRPEGTDGRACYSILRFGDGSVEVEDYQVEYDIEEAIEGISRAGLPGEYAEMLRQGKNLVQIVKGSDDPVEKQRDEQLEAVIAFAEKCEYEQAHSRQVTGLALKLFDELGGKFGLGERERFYLECAGVLHDIGWVKGRSGHHKESLKMIMKDNSLPFDSYEKSIIALVARYHRKACPKKKHPYYRDLVDEDKNTVALLGGILRVADGLDRSHFNLVSDVKCTVGDSAIVVELEAKGSIKSEICAAEKKADLLEKITQKEVIVKYDGL